MTKKNLLIVAAVIVIAAMSFWAGLQFQKAQYDEVCLDLGGGRNPGQYPICVVEQQNAALWLGPIRVTQNDVVELDLQRGEDGQSQIRLELTPEIASPLAAFTEQSIGQKLDIRIGGQLVNSVQVAGAIQGASFILALSDAQAEKLKLLLTRNTN
jgi:preprotein translocase subunit SecD